MQLCVHVRVRGTVLLLLISALVCGSRVAAAQDNTSLSDPLSGPIGDSLTNESATSGLSSEVVSGASSLVSGPIKAGISDPTGALLENSLRSPYVSAGAPSDPSLDFHADVMVDAARSSMAEVYSGSRAAFQPAFAGTAMASFRGGARAAAQRPAGSSLAAATPGTGSAFGRGTQQLQAFGATGLASDMTGTDASGNPLIYLDPNLPRNSTLVTDPGSIPAAYSLPGSPLPVLVSDNFAGPGGFPDSTRGTAGSPPEFGAPAQPFISQTGLRISPFAPFSQTDTFLHPTLLLNPVQSGRYTRLSTSPTPEQRRARMLAILSGAPETHGSGAPAFEQKRVDRLRNLRQRPGERPSRVTLSTTPNQ
jgi:hypothetical protein